MDGQTVSHSTDCTMYNTSCGKKLIKAGLYKETNSYVPFSGMTGLQATTAESTGRTHSQSLESFYDG